MGRKKDIPPKSAGARTADTPLTSREQQFVTAYWEHAEDGPKAAAAIGYAPRSAHVRAYELLARPNVAKAIAESRARIREQAEKEAGITLADVVKKAAQLAMFDVRLLLSETGAVRPPSEWPDDVAAAVAGIEVFEEKDSDGMKIGETVKVKLIQRTTPLDMLMKHLGGYEKDNRQKGDAGKDAVAELAAVLKGFQGDASRLPIAPAAPAAQGTG